VAFPVWPVDVLAEVPFGAEQGTRRDVWSTGPVPPGCAATRLTPKRQQTLLRRRRLPDRQEPLLQYYYASLEDFYEQHFFGLTHTLALPASGLRLDYVVQSGPLKGLGIAWANASLRSDVASQRDIDENRLILLYSISLRRGASPRVPALQGGPLRSGGHAQAGRPGMPKSRGISRSRSTGTGRFPASGRHCFGYCAPPIRLLPGYGRSG